MKITDKKTLSIIIPIRENSNVSIYDRLKWKPSISNPEIETILVDDGSENAVDIERLCGERGWKYVHLKTQDAPFSLARARNAGIRASSAKYVYFEDADFLHKSDFYEKAIDIASYTDESPFNFAAIPTIFLTEEASAQLIEKISDKKSFDSTIDKFVAGLPFINPDEGNDLCESFAPVGSNIIVRRDTCFHIGLFDEYFNSWGGEDRDFILRLLNHNSSLFRPIEFGVTKKTAIHRTHTYEGWRSVYKLHGDWIGRLGVYAVHIHHPENGWKEPYAREANFAYAAKKAIDIEARRYKTKPDPIPNEDLTIFIGQNPVFFNDEVMQAVGSTLVIEPDQRIDALEFAANVQSHNPTRVFFQNPYGNPWLLAVWRALKEEGITCICAERGALPWSIYFDEGGFCGDSPSYGSEHWRDSEGIDAKAYIDSLRTASHTLEPQGSRNIADLEGQIDSEKKNVLVLLQSLTDATTNFFCGEMGTYGRFLEVVQDLALLDKYNILVKDHPLNKEELLPGVGASVKDYNIYDLYEKSDVVLTLNSGAGLLALGDGIPVINAGASFYAQSGLAMQASTLNDIVKFIENSSIDTQQVDKFFGYLINEFYSFASWEYAQREYSAKTNMSLMSKIKYKSVRIGHNQHHTPSQPMNRYSLIMDSYALDLHQKKKSGKTLRKPDQYSTDTILADAYRHFHAKNYVSAAANFEHVIRSGLAEAKVLRAAAEAYDRAGESDTAIKHLKDANALAGGHKPITRRIQEMKRPRLLRTVIRMTERPYPVN